MKHGIEWLNFPGRRGETWNPWGGCSKVSEGCKNCWALRQTNRFKTRLPQYEGTVKDGKWTGRVNRTLGYDGEDFYRPTRWRKPRAIFACSMSDFFHEGADKWREFAWHQIYDTPQHLYLILTKRPERIPDCLPSFGKKEWPWKNVWLGATVENEDNLWRVEKLLNVEAAKRFLSLEPLLGNIYLRHLNYASWLKGRVPIDWVIAGGESGPGARPMHPDWARRIRDQCKAADIPYFFKQQGEWEQARRLDDNSEHGDVGVWGYDNQPTTLRESHGFGARASGRLNAYPLPSERVRIVNGLTMVRVGKKRAGRLLDGRTWDEFPHEQTP